MRLQTAMPLGIGHAFEIGRPCRINPTVLSPVDNKAARVGGRPKLIITLKRSKPPRMDDIRART